MCMYAIKLIDLRSGQDYLLLEEGDSDSYLTFEQYADADDFNFEFKLTLDETLTSEVVEVLQ